MSSARRVLELAAGFVMLACSACSGSSSSGGTSTSGSGSCTDSSDGGTPVTCIDYGSGFVASEVMQLCPQMMQTYSAGACPSANRIGRCELTSSTNGNGVAAGDAVSVYPPETVAQAKSTCAMENGLMGITATWVAQ